MKTALYFIITCFISTGVLLGAINAKNPFPAFGIAFGIWLLFLWGYQRRCKRQADRRYREKLFEYYIKEKLRETHRY
jgi:hypothetical protein